ncbi:hypothetical protein IQ250_11400 [Pseudanabaenaceae cyanobacterium LEGE 13415]|nr:hypothetical protein [Pseudanabaenaceae cyanobacterium LEGE 13415]
MLTPENQTAQPQQLHQKLSMEMAQKTLTEFLMAKKVVEWLKDNPHLLDQDASEVAAAFAGTSKLQQAFLKQFELF